MSLDRACEGSIKGRERRKEPRTTPSHTIYFIDIAWISLLDVMYQRLDSCDARARATHIFLMRPLRLLPFLSEFLLNQASMSIRITANSSMMGNE